MEEKEKNIVKQVDSFVNVKGHTFHFSTCDICDAQCCDGRRGSVHLPLVLEDFKEVSQYFPVLFVFGELGFLSACALLNDGKHYCRYIENNSCSIYEQRPSPCRFYPVSPHLHGEIFVDTKCPAVGVKGDVLIQKGQVNPNFYHPSFDHYHDKLVATYKYLHTINKPDDFENVLTIDGINYYKYIGNAKSEYIDWHRKSLDYMDNW